MKSFNRVRNICWLLLFVPYTLVATQDTASSLTSHQGANGEASDLAVDFESGHRRHLSGKKADKPKVPCKKVHKKTHNVHSHSKRRHAPKLIIPTPVLPTTTVNWCKGASIVRTVKAGENVKFLWQGGPHSVSAYYAEKRPDIPAYERTVALLKAHVSKKGPKGVSFHVGPPEDGNLQVGALNNPMAPFSLTFTIPNKGLYIFSSSLNYGRMTTKIIAV